LPVYAETVATADGAFNSAIAVNVTGPSRLSSLGIMNRTTQAMLCWQVPFSAFIAVLLLFASCASTQQYERAAGSSEANVFSDLLPSSGKAKIYVMRRSSIFGAAIAIKISDTGRPVGKVGSGGVIAWERGPGQVVLGASASNESNITLTVKEGEVFFVETRTNWGAGFNSAACEIRLLSNEEGQKMLASLHRPHKP